MLTVGNTMTYAGDIMTVVRGVKGNERKAII